MGNEIEAITYGKPSGRHSLAVILLTACIFSSHAIAQPIVVQVLNGRSGKPIAKARVYITFPYDANRKPLELFSNQQGEVRFESEESKFFEVRPMFLVACGDQPAGYPPMDYSIEETLRTGLVTQDSCGHSTESRQIGRLLYFVRPATWWEWLKN
jgi:hypothetical protein